MPHEDGVILYKELSRYDYNIKKYIYDKLKNKSNIGHFHNDFIGATEKTDGLGGFVPSPSPGPSNRYLCSDGNWKEIDVDDKKVMQNNTANNEDYRIMLSLSSTNDTENGELKKSSKFTANPSTGEFFAKGYKRIEITNNSFNFNEVTLSSGYPHIQRYICKIYPGYMTGQPDVPDQYTPLHLVLPFILDVELISWRSSNYYTTRQTIVSSDSKVYRRICNSGVWEQWKQMKYTDTKYDVMKGASEASTGKSGLVPAPKAGTNNRYLKCDGTWTSIDVMTGASTTAAGKSGLVPIPAAGAANRYLRCDGTWEVPSGTYSLPTATSSILGGVKTGGNITNTNGTISITGSNIVSALGYTPLSTHPTIDSTKTEYVHPRGFVFASTYYNFITGIKTDSNGHITETESYLRIPIPNGPATETINGLMTSLMVSKLNGIAEGANNYVHPTITGFKHIPAGGSSGQILRWAGDGTATWDNDYNTTYSIMTGATTAAPGTYGLVPAPSAGSTQRCLTANGKWSRPYTYGTNDPSEGSAGDVYFKYS